MKALEMNRDEGRQSREVCAKDVKSRRAVLGGIAVAVAGLGSLQQVRAEVGSVSWPIAAGASGRVPDKKTVQTTTSVADNSPPPSQTLIPDSEVEAMSGLRKGEEGVREGVRRLVEGNPQIAAGLLRLAFHDATARDTETGVVSPLSTEPFT